MSPHAQHSQKEKRFQKPPSTTTFLNPLPRPPPSHPHPAMSDAEDDTLNASAGDAAGADGNGGAVSKNALKKQQKLEQARLKKEHKGPSFFPPSPLLDP